MFGRKSSVDSHAWVEERLSEYIDNQLAASDRVQLEKHLTSCNRCRASLESLKWTVSLVKQAPVPVFKRSFVMAVPPRRQPTFAFGFARVATALATLLLFAVIGIDLITQFGSGMTASAPSSAAMENAPATQAVALAPQRSPTPPSVLLAAPTSAPAATLMPRAASASSSLTSSSAPLPLAPSATLTRTPARNGAFAETVTTAAQDNTKLQAAPSAGPEQPLVGAAGITATVTVTSAILEPTPTATSIHPTVTLAPTIIAQVQTAPLPVAPSQPIVSPLRFAEIGLLFFAVFFGVLVWLMRRK